MQTEQRPKKPEDNIQGSWDNFKKYNICVMKILGGKGREKETEEIF